MEYLDGVLDAATQAEWRMHLAECPACARYDRVLRRGLALLAAQPQSQLTPDFTTELHQRLALEERRMAMRPMTSLATASLMVAAMLAFAAWVPVLLMSRGSDAQVEVAVASASTASSEIAWHAQDAVDHQLPVHIHQARRALGLIQHATPVIVEPRYTPVILDAPTAPLNYVRTASYATE
jgi:anti-sigma factor RsiW